MNYRLDYKKQNMYREYLVYIPFGVKYGHPIPSFTHERQSDHHEMRIIAIFDAKSIQCEYRPLRLKM